MPTTIPPTRMLPGGARSLAPAAGVTVLVGLVLAVTLPYQVGSPSLHPGWSGAGTWTNGVLTASLATGRPAITVGSSGSNEAYGLYAGLSTIVERSTAGTSSASANLDQATWALDNRSGASGLDLRYSTAAPVLGSPSDSLVGSASIFVNFSSSATGAADAGPAGTVDFSVDVVGWPWLSAADSLSLVMPLWPQDTSVAFLAGSTAQPNVIVCRSAETNASLESFYWEPTAVVADSGGHSRTVEGSNLLVGNASLTSVELVFSGTTGGYSKLHYDPQLQVPVPLGPPRVTGPILWVIGGLGLVGLVVSTVGMRRVWNRPPSLVEWKPE